MTHPLLIDTDTLQKQLGKPGLVVIDVRGEAAYEFGGHIPGAVHSTWHRVQRSQCRGQRVARSRS